MVLLTMTPAMVEAVQVYNANPPPWSKRPPPSSEPSFENAVVGNPISHGQVIKLSTHLREQGAPEERHERCSEKLSSYHLDDLLRGSRVYVQPAKPRAEPTSEYKTLMARLRREEEARAYEKMINPQPAAESFAQRFPTSPHAKLFPASSRSIAEDEDEITYADINRQMALIINIMVSIVACSVAIWLAASHWSTSKRLGLSMGGSGVVAVAEVVVYAGYLRRLKEAKEKGKKEVETKEIIKSWVIGGVGERTDRSVILQNKPLSARRERTIAVKI